MQKCSFSQDGLMVALTCLACGGLLQDPVLDKQGHSFCLSCVTQPYPTICLQCGHQVTQYTKNRSVNDFLHNLQVACRSCQWSGKAAFYKQHAQLCSLSIKSLAAVCQELTHLLQEKVDPHLRAEHGKALARIRESRTEMGSRRDWRWDSWGCQNGIICVTCLIIKEEIFHQAEMLNLQRKKLIGIQILVID